MWFLSIEVKAQFENTSLGVYSVTTKLLETRAVHRRTSVTSETLGRGRQAQRIRTPQRGRGEEHRTL